MKQLGLAAVVFAGAISSWAEPQRFPISLTATVETDAHRLRITDQSLVTTAGNRLVLYIDLETYVVAIEEWDASLVTRVDRDAILSGTQAMLENFRMAQLSGKKMLMANLEMVDMDWDEDGELDHDGNLQMSARLKVNGSTGALTSLTATLMGVLNDPVNSGNLGENMLFTGRLRTTGPAF